MGSKSKTSADEASKKYMEKLDKIILATTDSEEEGSDIECEPCSKIFSSVQVYKQHLNSKKHYKMVSKLKTMAKMGDAATKKKPTYDPNHSADDSGDEQLYCDVCDKEMSGYKNYMAHLNGSIHTKNLKQQKLRDKIKVMKGFDEDALDEVEDDTLQKPFARCSTCGTTFYGPESYQQHLKGANHKKKLRQLKIIESLKNDETAAGNDMDVTYRCEACSKSFSGPVPYKMHLMSSVHQKELQRVKTEEELKDLFEKDEDSDKLVCKECKKAFPDAFSFKSHIANNSHGKQKVKDTLFDFVEANPDIVAVKSVQNVSDDEEDDNPNEKENFKNGQYFLVCKLCHASFSGPESARDHLESKKHMKIKIERAQKKALKDKLKGKQNVKDRERSATAYSEKVNPAANSKPKRASENPDDFEMI
ncbi:hypothetical protein JTE90_029110 [Oedothorax gibbosus]|uniref:C2H2-type domain-containing protein n=2 Tax=Oedothorax gibbosus TaxID=931172 RepID=A0AAV6V6S7_9ARAC|nr:hypothetical protein JTE90_029110 [Oedothorax gibbosus]